MVLARLDGLKDVSEKMASNINHSAIACCLFSMTSDVIKMSFGLDPALSHDDLARYKNVTSPK